MRIAEDAGYDFDLLEGVIEVNEEQFDRVADKVGPMAGGSLEGVKVAVWGLTFKARTDDLRESPALEIVVAPGRQGAEVRAYDPAVNGGRSAASELGRRSLRRCARAPRCWSCSPSGTSSSGSTSTRSPALMATPRVVDARNLLDRPALARRGFSYDGIGR